MLNSYSIYYFIPLMINVDLLNITSRKEEAATSFTVQNKTHQPEQEVLLPVQNQTWNDFERNVSFFIQNRTQKDFDLELESKAQNGTTSSRRGNDSDLFDVSDGEVTTVSNSSLDYRKYGGYSEALPGGFVPYFIPQDEGIPPVQNSGGFAPQFDAGGFGPQNYAGGFAPQQYRAGGVRPQNYAGGFAPQQYNAGGVRPQNYAGGYARPQYNAGGFEPKNYAGGFAPQQYNAGGFRPQNYAGGYAGPQYEQYNAGGFVSQKFARGGASPSLPPSHPGSPAEPKSNSGSSTSPSSNSEVPVKMLRQGVDYWATAWYPTTHLNWHGHRMLGMMKKVNLRRPYEIYPEMVGQRVLDGLPVISNMRDCHCPHVYYAVCGSDGVTYLNECVMNCMAKNKRYKKLQAHIRKEDRTNLTKKRDGPCILF